MKFIKFVVVFAMLSSLIYAEGGSVYTRFGLGDLNRSYSARRLGFGELGVAVYDRDFVGTLNPAGWSRLELTRFEVAVDFQNLHVKDNNVSNYSSLTRFSGFVLGVPMERTLGLSLVAGITPYSQVNYNVVQDFPDQANPYKTFYEGNGSVTKTFVGTSYTLPFDVSIGASLDYYIGNLNYISRISFKDLNIANPEYTTTYKISGLGGTFGLLSNDISNLLGVKSINNLRLGAALTYTGEFNSDSSLTRTTSLGSNTLATTKSTIKIPYILSAGVSFVYDRSLMVLFDYLYQPWGNFQFNGQVMPNMRNAQKVSAGVEYRNPDTRSTSFWDRLILRGGLSYEQTQYQINGKGIDQYSVYGGFSLPLEYQNTLDIGLQYSMRGTTQTNLLKENIFRVNVALSLGELWFFRPGR
ncbi:MAG: hypothetical protein ACM3S2_09635 [Ignavibacteriales bacterium]